MAKDKAGTGSGRFTFPVTDADFKKSSYSHPGGVITRCVEVARRPEGVAIRDSKDPGGGTLFFTKEEWTAFLQGARDGEFGA